jgi:hypothetical protein
VAVPSEQDLQEPAGEVFISEAIFLPMLVSP